MENQTIDEIIESLRLNEIIELDSIPNLDLYMDQVITLFEEKLMHTKRSESDKLLTKTMINNYAKDKLLMPAKKKKYTKEHIILMILLYEMKQILTISDIKAVFGTMIKEDEIDSQKLSQMYQVYLQLKERGTENFKEQVSLMNESLGEELQSMDLKMSNEEDPNIGDLLMVIMLAQKASYYKRLAEKIIDQRITDKNKSK